MFTYKYKNYEFFISVEYYHGIITFKTDYHDEPIKQRFMSYGEAEAKKQFRQHLRDIIDNPTQNNIFIEK